MKEREREGANERKYRILFFVNIIISDYCMSIKMCLNDIIHHFFFYNRKIDTTYTYQTQKQKECIIFDVYQDKLSSIKDRIIDYKALTKNQLEDIRRFSKEELLMLIDTYNSIHEFTRSLLEEKL